MLVGELLALSYMMLPTIKTPFDGHIELQNPVVHYVFEIRNLGKIDLIIIYLTWYVLQNSAILTLTL